MFCLCCGIWFAITLSMVPGNVFVLGPRILCYSWEKILTMFWCSRQLFRHFFLKKVNKSEVHGFQKVVVLITWLILVGIIYKWFFYHLFDWNISKGGRKFMICNTGYIYKTRLPFFHFHDNAWCQKTHSSATLYIGFLRNSEYRNIFYNTSTYFCEN